MVKKIVTIMLALMTGFVDPVSAIAEEKMQPQSTSVPEQTEAPTDLEGGISNGYPTPAPEENAMATDKTPDETTDASPDTVADDITGAGDEESSVSPKETEEKSKISASFESGVEEKEDGTYVWNVNPEEKEHTFAYRLELSKLDHTLLGEAYFPQLPDQRL